MENKPEDKVLDKALSILTDSLDGKFVDPNALDTAIRMTQFFWSSVYAERERTRQIEEAFRNKWEDEIKENDGKN